MTKAQLALALIGLAGLAESAASEVNTRVTYQVSVDVINWSSSVDVAPGSTVYVRTLVSYTGSTAVLGLSQMIYQPTVSHWSGGDTLLPLVNNGLGSNTSVPAGVVQGSEITNTTTFGRVSPWGRSTLFGNQGLVGHVNVNPLGNGVDYLRIARLSTTSWIGGLGNTTGAMGVPINQFSNAGREVRDPAFNSSLSDLYVFKFGYLLGPESGRTMVIDTPYEGFGNRNTATGLREVCWYTSMDEGLGLERGGMVVEAASVNVIPAPGALMSCAVAFAWWRARGHAKSDVPG